LYLDERRVETTGSAVQLGNNIDGLTRALVASLPSQ
jgi:hypothetical protein